jgi:predicted HTH transcriptional regulator
VVYQKIYQKKEIASALKLFPKNETSTTKVTNFAILMFSKRPDDFIPYSFVEIITDTLGSKSRMEAKNFKGPIWKQYYMVMKYIDDTFIRTITLREDGKAINKKVSNFPYKAVEELLANAIVHKNYEEGKTIQVYITNEEINIINYNKPLPPITLEDLNSKTIFMERDSVNPEIRDMFKDLGIIESYGTGVGEAKKACEANGNKQIYYKLFDDNSNITSVIIPCNEEYCELAGTKLRTDSQKLRTDSQKLRTEAIIRNSNHPVKTINNMDKIYTAFSETVFGPKDVIELLKVAPNTATSYIRKLLSLDVLDKIEGIGQSKYRFRK